MKVEHRHNLLQGFDFGLLEDPDFQEDSVREEIVAPILRGLGYSSSKPYRIIRSKKLLHPFVSIGSATKRISMVPDYLLEVNDRFAWVLEAKSPRESIEKSAHVEQAYSYAIHSEIRVPYFALCNGRAFVLYHISKLRPVLHFDMRELPACWDNLLRLLRPEVVLNYDHALSKDFGLHLRRLGFHEFESLVFPDIPITFLARLGSDHYSFSSGLRSDGESYVITFDFGSAVLPQLHGKIPENALQTLEQPFTGSVNVVKFTDAAYRVDVDCRVGDRFEENEDEIFLPLWVNRILSV